MSWNDLRLIQIRSSKIIVFVAVFCYHFRLDHSVAVDKKNPTLNFFSCNFALKIIFKIFLNNLSWSFCFSENWHEKELWIIIYSILCFFLFILKSLKLSQYSFKLKVSHYQLVTFKLIRFCFDNQKLLYFFRKLETFLSFLLPLIYTFSFLGSPKVSLLTISGHS